MRQIGAPAEQIEAMRAQREATAPTPYEVWPEHWHAVQVFLGMRTRWDVLQVGANRIRIRYQGLRYESLPAVIAAHRGNPHRLGTYAELFFQIQVLEAAALEVLNAR